MGSRASADSLAGLRHQADWLGSTLSLLSHRSEADIAGSKAPRPIMNRPQMQPGVGMLENMAESSSPTETRAPPPPLVLQTSINIRSTSLAVLAVIAVIGLLFFARADSSPLPLRC